MYHHQTNQNNNNNNNVTEIVTNHLFNNASVAVTTSTLNATMPMMMMMNSPSNGSNWSKNTSTSAENILSPTLFIPHEAALMASIGAILICVVGVSGNLLTIIALFRQAGRLNSSATTTFVIHLALTDLLFCLLVMPITSGRYWSRSWPFGSLLCRLYPFFYYGTVATSLMLIVMITINRFVLIAINDIYNKLYTKTNVTLMVLFCWIFSYGLLSIPALEIWGRFGYQTNTFSCTILRDDQGRSPKKFLFILGFFLPMSAIIICYGLILVNIRRQSKTSKSIKTPRRDLRLTLLICVVFGAFLICFLPLFIGNVFIPDHRYPFFHVFASMFAWLNSCINPFIYFAMNARYRQAFKRLFQNNKSSYSVNGGNGNGVGAHGSESTTNNNNNNINKICEKSYY